MNVILNKVDIPNQVRWRGYPTNDVHTISSTPFFIWENHLSYIVTLLRTPKVISDEWKPKCQEGDNKI
jgi:hypothetical protein